MKHLRVLVLLCLTPGLAWAQWAVIDVDAIRQMLTSYRTQLEQLLQAKRQLETEIESLRNIVVQVQQGATNLQALRLTNIQDVLGLLGRLEEQLAQANYVSYQVGQARSQAEALYARATGNPTAAQQREIYRKWTAVQRDSSALAVSAHAIQEEQAAVRQQWFELQQRAQAAVGNLQIQQAQAQGQALLGAQLQTIQQQLATTGHEQSLRQMEEATRTEMELNALEAAGKSMDTTYTPSGTARTLTTGRE